MIELKLGGEVRQLQFSHKAIKALQEHYGEDEFKKINVKDINHLDAILWACLLRYNKGLLIDEVEDMICDSLADGETDYDTIAKAVNKAITDSQVAKDMQVDAKKKTVAKKTKG